MSLSMYKVSAPVFARGLRVMASLLRKAQAHAEESGKVPETLLSARLADDMLPLTAQVQRASDTSKLSIERLTGKPPVGTRSWHTQSLLIEHGFIYNSHDTPDHRPHYVGKPDGSGMLLNLPFHYVIDDAMFFSFTWLNSENDAQRMMDPDHVEAIWWDAFMREYQQGGYLNICMHPFVSGRALRIAMLDRLITRMKALPGIWFPTCEQVARHVLQAHPPKRFNSPAN